MLPPPLTLAAIEDSLAEIQRESRAPHFSIDIATVLRLRSAPLYESSLFYWLITAWHKEPAASFEIISESKDERKLLEQCAQFLAGRALVLFPHGRISSVSRKTSALVRDLLLQQQRSWPDLAVSSSASLFCVDDYPDGLPERLYSNTETQQVVDWAGFRSLVGKLITAITDDIDARSSLQSNLDSLSTILHEFFKNTHQHARHWISGERFSSSVRGLYAKYYAASELGHREEGAHPNAATQVDSYVAALIEATRLRPAERHRQPIQLRGLLELTVFDTGPGLAQRWLNRATNDLPAQDEYDAVIKCFQKGRSSLPDGNRGYGLWKVLSILRERRAFLRVRTNRANLYRDFWRFGDYSLTETAFGREVPTEALFDWNKGLTTRVSDYAPVRGSVISVLLPVGNL